MCLSLIHIFAQRVSSIEDADQIIVLDDGKIAGVGTSEELLKTNDIYREVYESPVSYTHLDVYKRQALLLNVLLKRSAIV